RSDRDWSSDVCSSDLAAGACAVAGVHSRSWRRWLTASVLALLVIGGAVTAPFAIPLLPVDRFIAYQTALGVRQPSAENQEQGVRSEERRVGEECRYRG